MVKKIELWKLKQILCSFWSSCSLGISGLASTRIKCSFCHNIVNPVTSLVQSRWLGSASDWFEKISLAARPIRSATQIWTLACHQY